MRHREAGRHVRVTQLLSGCSGEELLAFRLVDCAWGAQAMTRAERGHWVLVESTGEGDSLLLSCPLSLVYACCFPLVIIAKQCIQTFTKGNKYLALSSAHGERNLLRNQDVRRVKNLHRLLSCPGFRPCKASVRITQEVTCCFPVPTAGH